MGWSSWLAAAARLAILVTHKMSVPTPSKVVMLLVIESIYRVRASSDEQLASCCSSLLNSSLLGYNAPTRAGKPWLSRIELRPFEVNLSGLVVVLGMMSALLAFAPSIYWTRLVLLGE